MKITAINPTLNREEKDFTISIKDNKVTCLFTHFKNGFGNTCKLNQDGSFGHDKIVLQFANPELLEGVSE